MKEALKQSERTTSPFNDEAIQEAAALIKKANEVEKRAIKHAEKCLGNPDFQKYRESYAEMKGLLVGAWLKFDDPDPVRYTVAVRGMAIKLQQLELLLGTVQRDARPARDGG